MKVLPEYICWLEDAERLLAADSLLYTQQNTNTHKQSKFRCFFCGQRLNSAAALEVVLEID